MVLRAWWCRLHLVCLLALAGVAPAWAQGLESVLAPGKLIEGHARYEDECKQCHVRFDRNAQDRLCMACHDKVGQDVRDKTGFHGRQKSQEPAQACRSCHTEHKGRTARIAEFDRQRFDHGMTDFALRGGHLKAECSACHVPARKYREAPHDCLACHRKDDVHKGSLGTKCADCHTETNWKEAKFDHGKTRFALTGKHIDTPCADCHKDRNYKETPRACVACHKRVDEQKGHQGQFGDRCESCHGTKAWKSTTFDHDTDTRYALRGKHRAAACTDCHTGPLFRQKLATECYACHRKDDKHQGSLGRDCASCHSERDWKERAKFDHGKTRFPLLGKHLQADCKACHKSTLFKEAPTACIGCHKQDDKHEGTLGDRCESCHAEKSWKTTAGRFDHDRTRFALRNAHARPSLACSACHSSLRSMRNTATECVACHKKDDKHEGQQGTKCESCHTDRSWRVASFDHAKTAFPLTGKHVDTACKSCHLTPRFKEAKTECYACHQKADTHKLRLGERCDTCHDTRDWKGGRFDHNQRSRYRLEGSHLKVACEACHTRPAAHGQAVAPLGTQCMACHRADDAHDGDFGVRCEQCHVPQSWKRITNRVSAVTTPRWLQ
ncbi:MAG: cytochrome C [Rhizobacter sp.]|nr:cytochrome C [Rhizobacter sp.]